MPRQSTQLSFKLRTLAAEYYQEEKLSLREVAAMFDIDHRNLARIFIADGIEIRSRTPIDPQDVLRLHAQGLSIRAMCLALRRSDVTIRRIMVNHNLPIKPQGRPKQTPSTSSHQSPTHSAQQLITAIDSTQQTCYSTQHVNQTIF